MEFAPEQECPCPNTTCERRTHCEPCFAHHAAMSNPVYCLREEANISPELLVRIQERKRAWEADQGR